MTPYLALLLVRHARLQWFADYVTGFAPDELVVLGGCLWRAADAWRMLVTAVDATAIDIAEAMGTEAEV